MNLREFRMWNQSGCVDGKKGSQEPETPVQNFAHMACVVTLYVAKFELWIRKAHLRARSIFYSCLFFMPLTQYVVHKQSVNICWGEVTNE